MYYNLQLQKLSAILVPYPIKVLKHFQTFQEEKLERRKIIGDGV